MFHRFRADYDLGLGALCYRRVLPAPEDTPRRRKGSTRSDPSLRVTVLPDAVLLEIEHHYTSGHAWMIDEDRLPVDADLATVCDAQIVSEVAEIQANRFAPTDLLALFEPRAGAGPNRVAPETADFLELGRSVTGDGKVPMLTLRLGRRHDEVVLDHSFVWPGPDRRLELLERHEPPATPESLAAITTRFGADMARAAALLREDPRRWLP
ncbi:MAG: hypothetical protein ACI8RZ_002439 [Myxococcota bacterium]